MSLQFEPAWSWLAVVGLFAVALVVIRSAYPSQIRHLATPRQRLLQLCRLSFLLLLFLVSLRPSISVTNEEESKSVIYLLTDASRSMQTEDASGGRTRRAAVAEFSKSLKPVFESLAERCEIRLRDFADRLTTITQQQHCSHAILRHVLRGKIQNSAEGRQLAIGCVADGFGGRQPVCKIPQSDFAAFGE